MRKTSAAADDGVRVIKKYPNRRLYDTATSSYVALADIKQLVMQHTPFVVRDAKTSDDLTRSILLQIILEEEADGTPLLNERMLANIIRFYGHAMQGFMGDYLDKNVQAFMDMQEQLAVNAKELPPVTHLMQHYSENAQQVYQNMQEQMQQQLQKQTEQMMDVMGLKRK